MNYNDIFDTIDVPFVKEVSPRLYLQETVLHAIEDPLTSPENVMGFVRRIMRDLSEEVLLVINLDNRCKIINVCKASIGTVDRAICTPRDVLKSSILSNASSFIICHNHISGDPHPSPADEAVTRKFVAAGVLLDLPCLDHIIIGGINGRSYSFLLNDKENFHAMRDKARDELHE